MIGPGVRVKLTGVASAPHKDDLPLLTEHGQQACARGTNFLRVLLLAPPQPNHTVEMSLDTQWKVRGQPIVLSLCLFLLAFMARAPH